MKPREVTDLIAAGGVDSVSAGEAHTVVILSKDKSIMATGANDKYQLGGGKKKKVFKFQPVDSFKKYEANGPLKFKSIASWNLNAAIDADDGVYLWGLLYDKQAKKSLCIKVPEKISDFRVSQAAIGPTMALLVEAKTSKSFVIGVNANGELGLGDKIQRKQLVPIPELKDKRLKQAAIG